MTTRAFIPAARFALLSPAYDLLCRWIGLGERFRRFELELLAADSPKKVLEVGCGSGELLRRLAERFRKAEITGLDIDPRMLDLARGKLPSERQVRLECGTAEALPFPAASFDLVLSSLMLHHLDSATKRRALADWRRVLAPEGTLVLIDFGVPRTRLARIIGWPLKFDLFEHQAENLRGRVPEMLLEAGFVFQEAGVFGGLVVAYRARPDPRHVGSITS